jgi:hypothetical protein
VVRLGPYLKYLVERSDAECAYHETGHAIVALPGMTIVECVCLAEWQSSNIAADPDHASFAFFWRAHSQESVS